MKGNITSWICEQGGLLQTKEYTPDDLVSLITQCFNDLQPPSSGMTVTVLATELAEAVAKDEANGEGFDMSAGMYGINVSDWIREVALVITETSKQRPTALQPQWVSVKTELPTEWVRVLVGNSVMTGNAYRYNGQWRLSASNDLILDKDITHWMNRPLPPSEGE